MSANLQVDELNPTTWSFGSVLASVLMMLFLGMCQSAASAQSMGSHATYSDSWVNDSAPENVVIIGTGVTQDNYNSYGHTYWVVTTLTSPSGRTSNATSYKTNAYNAYTSTETSLTWDWNDLGNYATGSQHWMCCPYMGGNPYTGAGCLSSSTTFALKAGASHAYYSFTSTVCSCCKYNIIPNCAIRCGPPTVSKAGNPGCSDYVLRLQGWVEVFGVTTCLIGTETLIDTLVAHDCFDEVY